MQTDIKRPRRVKELTLPNRQVSNSSAGEHREDHVGRLEPSSPVSHMNWYARLLAHHPYAVLSGVVVVAASCLVLSLTARPLPSFTDPAYGFESRGTVIAQRAVAWENLLKASRHLGPLSVNPAQDPELQAKFSRASTPAPNGNDTVAPPPGHIHTLCYEDTPEGPVQVFENCSSHDANDTTSETPMDTLIRFRKEHTMEHDMVDETGFFCNDIQIEYSHVVLASKEPKDDLFTLENIRAMCKLDAQLREYDQFQEICETRSRNRCCPSWSLPNYVAFLNKRESCQHVNETDIANVRRLLRRCAGQLDMEWGCSMNRCKKAPKECLENNAVYTILHFLTDVNFLNPEVSPRKHASSVELTMLFLPFARSSAALPFYQVVTHTKDSLTVDNVTVVAMDLGLKNILFDEHLINDTILLAIGGSVVVLLIWCYSGSLFITTVTITAVACSIIIAYFLYIFIFEITFFPFMNVLTLIIAIGLGADDTFIYCKVWGLGKQDKNAGTLVKLVQDALKHAAASILVTSLTTAAAFYASCVSHITAIRCFSIFAGTVVLANLVLMVTWVPACVVVAEKWGSSTCCLCVPPAPVYAPNLSPRCSVVCAAPLRLCYCCAEFARIYFEKILPCIVVKPRYLWVLLLGSLAVCSVVVVFYFPKLKLADTKEFQLFSGDHEFEKYDFVYKDKFWFERKMRRDIANRLPIRIVWGIKPVDNGDYLNPDAKGTLEYDEEFDVSLPEAQQWLLEFCHDLRNQSFYKNTLGPLLPNCFIETFKSLMERRCMDPIDGIDRSPCCENSTFPYSQQVFNQCLHGAIRALYQTPPDFFLPGVAGPKFCRETGSVAAVVVEYDSNYLWTVSYDEMHQFYNEVETWVQRKLETAPPSMKGGWFTSYLSFYDLQRSLSIGTGVALGVAVGVALTVLLLTTLNLLISLLATFTIAAIMFTSIGILVLLGWRLNILESITVSVAIGLAVDFTLHYGVTYRLSPEPDRESSVIWAVARMGSPVFMAATTTVVAGAFMLPSQVLAYIQIGTFIVVIMTASYLYSTLFFLSLLRLFGPEAGCGQLQYPRFNCCEWSQGHVDKTVYQHAFSESTLSTSSTCCPPPSATSDTHELEPLTAMRLSRSGGSGGGGSGSGGGRGSRHKVATALAPPLEGCSSSHHQHHHHHHHHPALGVGRGRSGSLTTPCRDPSMGSLVAAVPRKVSLPCPAGPSSSGTEGAGPSPRHVVAPASSSTTILYSEPDTESQQRPSDASPGSEMAATADLVT
ncbi:protein dispatched homolog 1-like [Oratosquilla oratoria]|uniref:protein dispatched homolog 1-like n=1 Tax=Oratosquilla oratoria TaxID=337810 RepID=UPI003F767DD7